MVSVAEQLGFQMIFEELNNEIMPRTQYCCVYNYIL